jgi:RNA polymerase sigma-70 factor
MTEALEQLASELIAAAWQRCHTEAPNYGVTLERFEASIRRTIDKYLVAASEEELSEADLREFFANLQAEDLFLALGCAAGNERAWWEFDQSHRSYMERVARHLARTDIDAEESIGAVYVELYGTRIVDGERVSKFASYSGRGSLRGWLRTVIWHTIVDQHRAGQDEVSLEEMTEAVGEGAAQAAIAGSEGSTEAAAIDKLAADKYRKATLAAISAAFEGLEPHEKLLLMYYHVEGLKLREIARLVENEDSPLRRWFQRKSAAREAAPSSRVHESTVMRWLERCYAEVLSSFREHLAAAGLNPSEIEICKSLAAEDLAGPDIYSKLSVG